MVKQGMELVSSDELSQFADALLTGSHSGILIANEKYQLIYANEMVYEITGYTRDEIIGNDFRVFISKESLEKVTMYYKLRLQGKKVPDKYDAAIIHKSGRKIYISINTRTLNLPGKPPRTVAQILDITDQKLAEARSERMLRLYNVLRQIYRSFQHVTSAGALYREICRIFTQYGDFALCWIGRPNTQTRRFDKIEVHGPEAAFLERIEISTVPVSNQSPTALAFINGTYQFNNHIKDSRYKCFCREKALRHNLNSVAAVPVRVFDKITSVITLFSYEEDFFDTEESELIEEAAADIGFALEKLELKQREDTFRNQLLENEQRYELISRLTTDYMYAHSVDDNGNQQPEWSMGDIQKICGYSEQEILKGTVWPALVLQEDTDLYRTHTERIANGIQSRTEYRIRSRDGSIHWVQDDCFPVFDSSRKRIIKIVGALKDISIQKELWLRKTQDAEKIARIYATLADAILVIDDELRITEANETAVSMFGYKRKTSLIGKNIIRFLNPDNLMENITRLKELEVTDKLLNISMDARRIRNKKFPALISLSKLKGPDNQWNGFVAIIKDISRHEAQKKEIAAMKEELEMIISNSPAAFYSFEVINNRINTKYISRNLTRLLGYEPDELSITTEWWESRIHPDDYDHVMQNKERLLNKGYLLDEYRIRHKSGNYIWIRDEVKLIRDTFHAPLVILGTWINVTQGKMAEEELRFLALALRSVNEYVTITDLDDRLIFVNDALCRAYGYTSAELLGQKIEIFKSQFINSPHEKFNARIIKKDGWSGELLNTRKDGSVFPIYLSTSVIRDTKNNPIAYIGVARDISEIKELEQQLIQAQRLEAIGRLAGGIAHDFNNLLTVILGSAQLAQLHITHKEKALPLIRQIEEASERAGGLTRQLLAFSRKQVMETRVFNVNDSIGKMAKILHRLLGEHIELQLLLDDKLPAISADPNQFEMVIMNLCVNSRDAMPTGGKIEIRTGKKKFRKAPAHLPDMETNKTYIHISIKDNGHGIPDEALPHIFEPFFTTKAEGRGTGLGLASVYGIVKQSRGIIDVDSSQKGTVFHIYFPASREPVVTQQETEIDTLHTNAHILVVEDQPEVRDLIVKVLSLKNYHTTAIPPDALPDVLENNNLEFNLLLTDVIMPKINGVEAAQLYLKKFPDGKIIFMSGYTSDILEKSGLNMHTQNILAKPFTPRELYNRIQKTLTNQSEGVDLKS